MKASYHPAIVIAAFNRVDSLRRVLKSISLAHYPENVQLIISIDNNGTNQDVFELAKSFQWNFGEKEVIYQKERLGLRKHILKCGDLSLKYGSIIMLEDDLYVSPYFYKYTLEALDFYGAHPKIAGISLYKISYAEANKLPFNPIEDHSDVFFMQLAASLGQCWTAAHWEGFKKWYNTDPDLKAIDGVPEKIKNWSDGSWKKYYIGYLIVHDKYFVFPQISYTTNFNDVGENMIMRSLYVQVPIQFFDRKPTFISIEESKIVYDAYSEITSGSLNQLTNVLSDYDFEADLYGKKDYFSKPYILTTRPVRNHVLSFERSMKPHEMNVIMNIEGSEIFLAKKEDVIVRESTIPEFLREFAYFYTPIFRTSKLLEIIKFRLKDKYLSRFNRKS